MTHEALVMAELELAQRQIQKLRESRVVWFCMTVFLAVLFYITEIGG